MNPDKMPVIQEAIKRGLGEGRLEKIEILGTPIEIVKEKFSSVMKTFKAKK